MGRAASANSYLGGAVLAVGALNALQPSDTRDRLLADVASGAVRLAVAIDSSDFVPDAEGADRVLLIADATASSSTRPSTVTPQPVLDETRRLATVSAQRRCAAVCCGSTETPTTRSRACVDRAAVAIACDSLGLCEAMLSATVAYAKVRHQFDRPIGSFQAVKHACADMLVSDRGGPTARRRGGRCRRGGPTGCRCRRARWPSRYACGAAVDVVGKAMQLHGGIGYTWESGIHVYLKRAALNRSLFGSPAAHRKELAKRYR